MEEFLETVADAVEATSVKRQHCSNCNRPKSACWCSHLPYPRVSCQTKVYILQTPAERYRPIQTALMLRGGLEEGLCRIITCRKMSARRNLQQAQLLNSPNSLLLYPGPDAVPIHQIPKGSYNLVLLDGTWTEAKRMYNQNEILKSMKSVILPMDARISQFIIRTQPRDGCLSTVESAAMAISILEDREEVYDLLSRPLLMACEHQLSHGAVVHESKETKKEKLEKLTNGEV